jgi:Zn-dependent protease with chaperone function
MLAGAVAAKVAFDWSASAAWATGLAICVVLFLIARLAARTPLTGAGFLLLLTLGCLAFAYLLVLAGESLPRPRGRDPIGLFVMMAVLLTAIVTALVVPLSLIVLALRGGAADGRPAVPLRLLLEPLVPALAIFLVLMLLFGTALSLTPRAWRSTAMLTVLFGGPILVLPLWTFLHRRRLRRWQIADVPPGLADGLDRLRERTGGVFDEVMCLDGRLSQGRECLVLLGPRRACLVISNAILDIVSPEQLFALLAHEAAHVRLHHLRRKLAWGAAASAVALGSAVGLQLLAAPLVPRGAGFAGVLAVILPVTLLRHLYDTYVVRRHEAEADRYAVGLAGSDALLGALAALGAGATPAHVHNRWTTHGTWEQRVAGIRDAANAGSARCP